MAALGDTLFPSPSLADALAADLSATAHVLIRLRVLHPFVAVATAAFLVWLGSPFGVPLVTPARRRPCGPGR